MIWALYPFYSLLSLSVSLSLYLSLSPSRAHTPPHMLTYVAAKQTHQAHTLLLLRLLAWRHVGKRRRASVELHHSRPPQRLTVLYSQGRHTQTQTHTHTHTHKSWRREKAWQVRLQADLMTSPGRFLVLRCIQWMTDSDSSHQAHTHTHTKTHNFMGWW